MGNPLKEKDIVNYKIYLVNKGADAKIFWCFFGKPEAMTSNGVYANSNIMLNVLPNYQGINLFTIPYQYQVAAGATNKPLRLNVKNEVSIMKNAQLQSSWRASYATAPPKQGPLLDLIKNINSLKGTISIETNNYNPVKNHENQWYNNMSFGIKAEGGFTGITWEPSPENRYVITPKFSLYIATGSYTSNTLASINKISTSSAIVSLNDFKNHEATVTLEVNGSWTVAPGAPSQS
jgi:hypothetical protein